MGVQELPATEALGVQHAAFAGHLLGYPYAAVGAAQHRDVLDLSATDAWQQVEHGYAVVFAAKLTFRCMPNLPCA